MDFRILGPLVVLEGERPLPIKGAMERSVLAILLLSAGRVVAADRLIDELWGDEPPATARNSLHVRVARLRKALGRERILSQGVGYLLRVEPGEFDLERFEQLVAQGGSSNLREALSLWRGPALAEFAHERWAWPAIARLEELRLAALEKRIDADLELGLDSELVVELEASTAEHPLRERLRAQWMLALYRSGRQADALEAYQNTRNTLVDEFGIEPSPVLRQLQTAILRQDPSLDLERPATAERSILVAALDESRLAELLALAEPLARRPRHELILFRPLASDGDLVTASAALQQQRERLRGQGVTSRAAVFTSSAPGLDIARLATEQSATLLIVDVTTLLLADPVLADLLAAAPCDVAMLVGGTPGTSHVLVPFTGTEHDWSAIEIGAWLARALSVPLTLAGPADDERDASRLLASASLAVQRALDVAAQPILVEPGVEGLIRAANDAVAVVAGLSDRWQKEGLGLVRSALAARAGPPILLVRGGVRPGGLAPAESNTRFTWSLQADR